MALTPEQREARAREVHDLLDRQLAELHTAEGWHALMERSRQFSGYSFSNLMLIWAQFPSATAVAGFRKWKELGRVVRKGETGIKIYGYSTYVCKKDDCRDKRSDGKPHRHKWFPIVSVFDYSQTEPLDPSQPDLDLNTLVPKPLNTAGHEETLVALGERLADAGFIVQVGVPEAPGVLGSMRPGRIMYLSERQGSDDQLVTMLHEAAHHYLGHLTDLAEYGRHRGVREVEAESVAHIAASLCGRDSSTASFGYIAKWGMSDPDAVRRSAERVIRTASALVTFINEGIEPPELELDALDTAPATAAA